MRKGVGLLSKNSSLMSLLVIITLLYIQLNDVSFKNTLYDWNV